MKKTTSVKEDMRLARILEENLLSFPLAYKTDEIIITRIESKIIVEYKKKPVIEIRKNTYFDLQIEPGLVFISAFRIEESKKRMNYGTLMYQSIESFARQIQIAKLRTIPSGEGDYFWPKMGFVPSQEEGTLEKLI